MLISEMIHPGSYVCKSVEDSLPLKAVAWLMRPSTASLKSWLLAAAPVAKCIAYSLQSVQLFCGRLGKGMDEPSSPQGIILYGVYTAVLQGSVLDDTCHGWSFDQQGTHCKNTTCLVTVICHEMGSEEWVLPCW